MNLDIDPTFWTGIAAAAAYTIGSAVGLGIVLGMGIMQFGYPLPGYIAGLVTGVVAWFIVNLAFIVKQVLF